MARHDINEQEWVNQLIRLLTGKARAACNEVDAQEAILEKFEVTPQASKARFRQMKFHPKNDVGEHMAQMETLAK